jgi:hypothetical protein
VRIGRVTHNGSCGYRCLARFLGLPSWLEAVELLYQFRDHAYVTQQSKRIIVELRCLIMDSLESDREGLDVPTHLYLTATMRKLFCHENDNIFVTLCIVDALAVIKKSRFLIFKDCQDSSHVGLIATHVSPALTLGPSYAGVVHALYLHGASNVMFDPMIAASTETEDEYVESLARIARELTKALETHNLQTGFAHIVDSDDGASQETLVDEKLLEDRLSTFHSVRQSSQVYCDQCVHYKQY